MFFGFSTTNEQIYSSKTLMSVKKIKQKTQFLLK